MKAILGLCVSALAAGQAAAATVEYTNLQYATASARNVLDLSVPTGITDAPLVLFVHGGAWFFGDKAMIEEPRFGKERFLDAGYAVASMNYRFSTEATWPAQLEDMGAALFFLNNNGATYGYDSNRLALFGESAGAHLALSAGLAFAGDPERDVDAVVSWYGITDLENIDNDRAAIGLNRANDGANSPESRLIGADVEVETQLAAAASPLYILDDVSGETEIAPFLLVHGGQDTIIPYLQSKRLFDAMIADGRDASYIFYPEGTHGGGTFANDPQSIETVIGFLDDQLKPSPIPLPAGLPLLIGGLLSLFAARRVARRSSQAA